MACGRPRVSRPDVSSNTKQANMELIVPTVDYSIQNQTRSVNSKRMFIGMEMNMLIAVNDDAFTKELGGKQIVSIYLCGRNKSKAIKLVFEYQNETLAAYDK